MDLKLYLDFPVRRDFCFRIGVGIFHLDFNILLKNFMEYFRVGLKLGSMFDVDFLFISLANNTELYA